MYKISKIFIKISMYKIQWKVFDQTQILVESIQRQWNLLYLWIKILNEIANLIFLFTLN